MLPSDLKMNIYLSLFIFCMLPSDLKMCLLGFQELFYIEVTLKLYEI
jgi:hypothetical protein